jgi:glycerophosphoryl diester phosphodiesterase
MAPLVIAHRGASAEAPENTLPAFELAIGQHADYVEFDVQATADGALVVFHDLDLDRLTSTGGPLRRRTLAELRGLGAGIPTLAEVLDLCAGRIGVMAELKSPRLYRRHDLVGRTLAALERALEPEQSAVLSFEPRALAESRLLAPQIRTVQHVWRHPFARAREAWAIGLPEFRATPRTIARAQSLGVATTVYTVDDEERMRELARLGVTGIFSNRPAVLRSVVDD